MNLKIAGKRSFPLGTQPFNENEWKSFEYGLYDVTYYPNSIPGQENNENHILMFWGHDENTPHNRNVVLCMPFPGFSVVEEQERQIITEEPKLPIISTGIDGDVLLKAIAIAQDPKLALELLG